MADNYEYFLDSGKKIHKFEIETEIDGKKVTGQFATRYPSVVDTINIDVAKSRMLAGADPEVLYVNTVQVAEMLAHLQTTLTESPDWFELNTIEDTELLLEVYTKVRAFENSFRGKDKADGHSPGGPGQDDQEAMEG